MRYASLAGACLVLAFGCATSRARPSEPIAPDRPGEATPPSVVAPGIVQVEGGATFARSTRTSEPDTNTLVLPGVLLRYGLFESAEFEVLADGWIREWVDGERDRSNGSDVSFGAKVRFTNAGGWKPAFAARFLLSVPTGGSDVTSDGVDPDLDLLAQWNLSDDAQVVANAEFGVPSRGADNDGRFFVFEPQLALQYDLSERVSTFVEYAATFASAGEGSAHFVDGGLAWLVRDDLQLDLSAGAGLDSQAPDFFVSLGWAFRFALPR